MALGMGVSRSRMKFLSLADEKIRKIPSSSYTTVYREQIGIYEVETQKGEFRFLYAFLFPIIMIPIPLPFIIPTRLERVVVYENTIPIKEYRSQIEDEFIGITCNYLFPLVGTGCSWQERTYFNSDPKLHLQYRLEHQCSPESTASLNFQVTEKSVFVNRTKLDGEYSKQIKKFTSLPLLELKGMRNPFHYIQNEGFHSNHNEYISFVFLQGVNQFGKSCSYQGKLEILGTSIQDYQKVDSLLMVLDKKLKRIEQSSSNAVWKTSTHRIYVEWNQFGYIRRITIGKI
jgi:hypothetical protein